MEKLLKLLCFIQIRLFSIKFNFISRILPKDFFVFQTFISLDFSCFLVVALGAFLQRKFKLKFAAQF